MQCNGSDRRELALVWNGSHSLAFISLGIPDAVLGFLGQASRLKCNVRPLARLACRKRIQRLPAGDLNATRLGKSNGTRLVASGQQRDDVRDTLLRRQRTFVASDAGAGVHQRHAGGALDVVINAFASIRFSARWLNWMHACWGIGAATVR